MSEILQEDRLLKWMAAYHNSAEENAAVFHEFTRRTDAIPFLKTHRDWVETHQWGYGDRAFHYLWLLIIQHIGAASTGTRAFLEIGVFKGQVLSLWALCAEKLGVPLDLFAISPFAGNMPKTRVGRLAARLFSPDYRTARKQGSLYFKDDYLEACATIFKQFGLRFENVHALRGKSDDDAIFEKVRNSRFSVVYIDGDHSLKGAQSDIRRYAPLIEPGGLLVMDDAACELPGTGFFKGHPEVSEAARIIPSLGFENVLNVGHNRVYIKL